MWAHFDGKARTLQDSVDYLARLTWTDWKPQGITLHNTAAPTLKQWAESGPNHDARIMNLQSYYEGMGWHAGPHWFISRTRINWFSNPLLPGVHSRCYNSTRFGIEMVGDFDSEDFNSGDGAMVRDLALPWVAALNVRFGFKAPDIVFHRECKLDNHACPGDTVVKSAVIARVMELMSGKALPQPAPPPPYVKRNGNVSGVSPGDVLNVRPLPSVNATIQARLSPDTPVVIVGEKQNGDTLWYQIERPHSSTGWVSARYIMLR